MGRSCSTIEQATVFDGENEDSTRFRPRLRLYRFPRGVYNLLCLKSRVEFYKLVHLFYCEIGTKLCKRGERCSLIAGDFHRCKTDDLLPMKQYSKRR